MDQPTSFKRLVGLMCNDISVILSPFVPLSYLKVFLAVEDCSKSMDFPKKALIFVSIFPGFFLPNMYIEDKDKSTYGWLGWVFICFQIYFFRYKKKVTIFFWGGASWANSNFQKCNPLKKVIFLKQSMRNLLINVISIS